MGISLNFYLTRNQLFLGQGRFCKKRVQFLKKSEKSHCIIFTILVVIHRTKFLAICGFSIGWNVQNAASISLFERRDFSLLLFLDVLEQHFQGNSLLCESCNINVLEPKYGHKIRAFWFRAGKTSPSPQLDACL